MEKLATHTSRYHIRRWDLYQQLGLWEEIKNTHQYTEWNLDARTMSLYRYNDGVWKKHRAVNYGRLRFESTEVVMTEPRHITHKADGMQRRQQIELSEIHAVQPYESEGGNDPADIIYTSEIQKCFHALPKHVRRLVGNIPEIALNDIHLT
jgi:hypothetical protein